MSAVSGSLLTYIDTPVVVGDPDGCVAYVNPAFEKGFSVRLENVVGQPLANLFDGGARESVLGSVAEACQQGETVRFRIRQDGTGFGATASPIVAADSRVGVVVLFVELAAADERSLAVCRQMIECLDDLDRLLDEMLQQTAEPRSERHRVVIEDGAYALARARKWSGELLGLIAGKSDGIAARDRFDLVAILRGAVARARPEFDEAGLSLELVVPAQLPALRGDTGCLEQALSLLMQIHRAGADFASTVTIAARVTGHGDEAAVVISVVGGGESEGNTPEADVFAPVRELVEKIGGEVQVSDAPLGGRTTAIRLHVA